MKRKRLRLFFVLLFLIGLAGGGYLYLAERWRPMPAGPKRYIRWERPVRLGALLADLQKRGIVRDANAARVYALFRRTPSQIQTGTYELAPGMDLDAIFRELQKPIRQSVRIPETNWARRTAHMLQNHAVLQADEYMKLVSQPSLFKGLVHFPLPTDSFEGYLYPDTYDLPPLLGARAVIERQLKNFDKKVWEGLHHPANLRELLIKASLIQMEAGHNEEALVGGVIENRLNKKMRLQLDASLLYGIQKWRKLTFADYKNIDSPYNLYLVDGLPPGPICSPALKAIQGAMNPAHHEYLYYVALPGGQSLFSKTYEEHLHKIALRRKAMKALNP